MEIDDLEKKFVEIDKMTLSELLACMNKDLAEQLKQIRGKKMNEQKVTPTEQTQWTKQEKDLIRISKELIEIEITLYNLGNRIKGARPQVEGKEQGKDVEDCYFCVIGQQIQEIDESIHLINQHIQYLAE